MIRIQSQRRERNVEVAVVPMINIVFLLLLYFLVAGRLMDTSGPAIELPLGGGQRAAAPPVAVLVIDVTGSIYVGERVLAHADLGAYLAALPRGVGSAHVLVRADGRADASVVHEVMDACREAGIALVELATLEES